MSAEIDILKQIQSDSGLREAQDKLPPFWTMVSNRNEEDVRITEHLIESGNTIFGFYKDLGANSMYLSWVGKVPEDLKPGRGPEGYEDFLYFSIRTLPQMLFDYDDYNSHLRNYLKSSMIGFSHSSDPFKVKYYPIENDRNRASLYKEYSGNFEDISLIHISIRSPEEYDEKYFDFQINSLNEDNTYGSFNLFVPLNNQGLIAWTSRLSNWAIETHAYSDGMHAKEVAAKELSQKIELAINEYKVFPERN